MVENITALRELREKVTSASLDDKLAFAGIIKGTRDILGYTDLEIARAFNCSIPTVGRWIDGTAAPFAGMRRVIFEKLTKKLDEKLSA